MLVTTFDSESAFGYKQITTFFQDFSIADNFGEAAIKDTYDRAFKEWKDNYKYLTELVLVLNWKIWQWHGKNNDYAKPMMNYGQKQIVGLVKILKEMNCHTSTERQIKENDMAECDYTLELYNNKTDKWIKQIMVSDKLGEIHQYMETNPISDDYRYSVWCIEYDEKGEEVNSFPWY